MRWSGRRSFTLLIVQAWIERAASQFGCNEPTHRTVAGFPWKECANTPSPEPFLPIRTLFARWACSRQPMWFLHLCTPSRGVMQACGCALTSSTVRRRDLVTEWVDMDLWRWGCYCEWDRLNTEAHVKSIAFQLLSALAHCHSHCVYHRHLKPTQCRITWVRLHCCTSATTCFS